MGLGHDARYRERDRQLLHALSLLFRAYCRERGLATATERLGASLLDFVQWLTRYTNSTNLDEHPALRGANYGTTQAPQALGADAVAWLQVAPADPGAMVDHLRHLWPQLVTCDRPEPTHSLRRMQLALLCTWADGQTTLVQHLVTQEMFHDGKVNDGLAASLLTAFLETTLALLMEKGLDGLHALGEDLGADYEREVLMGVIIKLIPQLKPELHERLHRLKRLVQCILLPPIPPEVRQQLAAQQKAQHAAQGKVTGGWTL